MTWNVAFTRRSLKGREISSPTTTISVRLRLFQNWNSQCCKCQAFITHNLFISLHIKLVNVFSSVLCESDQGCMQTTMMNDCTSSPCAQITFPSCSSWGFSCRYCYRMCSRRVSIEIERRTARDEGGKRRNENLTPNSCQISRSLSRFPVCVCQFFNRLILSWFLIRSQFKAISLRKAIAHFAVNETL